MAKQEPEILTITEVAEYLKVAERTIYRLAASKKIPAFRVGGAWRFAKADIERWIKAQTVTSIDLKGQSHRRTGGSREHE